MATSGISSCDKVMVQGTLAAAARDVSPSGLKPDVTVLYLPADQKRWSAAFCNSVVSGEELARAARFKSESDRERFIRGRSFRRYCGAAAIGAGCPIGSVRFEDAGNGRPYLPALPGTAFSFSGSAQGHLAAWSSRHDVGVDIEDPERCLDVLAMARYHYAKAEAELITRAPDDARRRIFVSLWALKEAALKSIGEGIGRGLDAFQFRLEPAPRILAAPKEHGGAASFHARLIEGLGGNAVAAICVRRRS